MTRKRNRRFLKTIYPFFLLIICFVLVYPQKSPAQLFPYFGAPYGGNYGAPVGGYPVPYTGAGAPFGGYQAPYTGTGVPFGGFQAPYTSTNIPFTNFSTTSNDGATYTSDGTLVTSSPLSYAGIGAPFGSFQTPYTGTGAPFGGFQVPYTGTGAPFGGFQTGAPFGGFQTPYTGTGAPFGMMPNQFGMMMPNQFGMMMPNQFGMMMPNQFGMMMPNQFGMMAGQFGMMMPNQFGMMMPNQFGMMHGQFGNMYMDPYRLAMQNNQFPWNPGYSSGGSSGGSSSSSSNKTLVKGTWNGTYEIWEWDDGDNEYKSTPGDVKLVLDQESKEIELTGYLTVKDFWDDVDGLDDDSKGRITGAVNYNSTTNDIEYITFHASFYPYLGDDEEPDENDMANVIVWQFVSESISNNNTSTLHNSFGSTNTYVLFPEGIAKMVTYTFSK